MKKELMLMILSGETKDAIKKDMRENGVESGLFLRSSVGKEIFNQLQTLTKRGYFPVAFNFEEDSFNMEVMFQRHPKQTKEMKMVELKI